MCFFHFPLVPDAPLNIMADAIYATAITISWTLPASTELDTIILYIVEVYEGFSNLSTIETNTTGPSITVTGLEEHTLYYFRVAAVTNGGIGPFSILINFTTSEAGSTHNI